MDRCVGVLCVVRAVTFFTFFSCHNFVIQFNPRREARPFVTFVAFRQFKIFTPNTIKAEWNTLWRCFSLFSTPQLPNEQRKVVNGALLEPFNCLHGLHHQRVQFQKQTISQSQVGTTITVIAFDNCVSSSVMTN